MWIVPSRNVLKQIHSGRGVRAVRAPAGRPSAGSVADRADTLRFVRQSVSSAGIPISIPSTGCSGRGAE